MYPIQASSSSSPSSSVNALSSTLQWHQKLGHPHSASLQHLVHQFQLPIPKPFHLDCTSCNVAKSHKLPFTLSDFHAQSPFELMHMDVWGPAPVSSFNGFKYYLVIILDDFTRYIWLFPMHYKSDVKTILTQFCAHVNTQFNCIIKSFRSDNGGEFINKYLCQLFLDYGLIHQTSCPHTPEQNGRAERVHRHLIETTLALLHQAAMPVTFWLEALITSVYLINRLPHSAVHSQIPYTLLFNKAPDYSSLKPFGCLCFPWLKPYISHKLCPKSQSCVFLGYCSTSKGYRCFDHVLNKVYKSRHVKFVEHIFPYASIVQSMSSSVSESSHSSTIQFDISLATENDLSLSIPSIPITTTVPAPAHYPVSTSNSSLSDSSSFHNLSQISSPNVVPTSSPTSPVPSPAVHPMITRSKHGIVKPRIPLSLSLTSTSEISEPSTFSEAIKSAHWQPAMSTEYEALLSQGTWSLVPSPAHGNIIGCHWIFKLKRHSDGSIARYKARLVARGNQQTEGLDFTETFCPVIKQPTLKLVLALAVHFGWQLKQLDVTNAFLHGVITEDVYMKQPPGYIDPQRPQYVCKLHKALYGLRQAPRAWYALFSTHLQSLGFHNSLADTSLFVLSQDSDITYVLIYVDDIIVTGNNSTFITTLLSQLQTNFALKDLGDLHYFLGIEVLKTSNGLILTQHKYALDLLLKAGMTDCKPSLSPSSVKPSTVDDSIPFLDVQFYRSIVGSLQYLTITKPEISHAVNYVCQFMHAPSQSHFAAVKRILRYIKGSLDQGLYFTPSSLFLTAFCDADWAGDHLDRKSTSGFCVFLGDNLISWSAKKQGTVSRSSTEAEYRALAHTTAELMWLLQLITDLHISLEGVPVIFCDNLSAIALASNPVFHARTKHIEVDYHFIREKVLTKQVCIHHVGSEAQTADIFTKPVSVARFQSLASKLMVKSIPMSLQGAISKAH